MWEQIRSNRIRSHVVVAVMGVVLVLTGLAIGYLLGGDPLGPGTFIGGLVALGLWFVLWLVARTRGDRVMLAVAGAREIRKEDHPRLVNVVEEMTIAAELPKPPRVFIVDDPAPNAFATGTKPDKAAVAVTTGLLERLTRDELQGVVAHEVGHVRNRDVALMTTAGVMMGAIVILAEVGLRVLWFGGGRRRSRTSSGDGGGQVVVLIIAIVMMILAPIMAQLLYFALSRRREYLADASGARFTRYPEGLAAALGKLQEADVPLANKSRVTKPMYIVAALARRRGSLLATHPPLEQRIRILRGMGGSAGYKAYEEAYRRVAKKGILGGRTLQAADDVPVRPPEPDETTPSLRGREASDALLAASRYVRLSCPSCSATLKIPPKVFPHLERCPRCHAGLDRETLHSAEPMGAS